MKIYLSLGSNLGNRKNYINSAISKLENKVGKLITKSSFYETKPWGFKTENNFINIAAIFETKLQPLEILSKIHNIEKELDRLRKTSQYENRTIDIDIIFYDKLIFQHENLQIPHIHAHKRQFVLEPFCEIAPNYIHPKLKISVTELLKKCTDNTKINLT